MKTEKIKKFSLAVLGALFALSVSLSAAFYVDKAAATERPDGVLYGTELINAADYVTLDGEGNEQVDASWQTENKLTKIGGWAKNKDGPVQLVTENGEKAFKFTFHRGDQWAGTSGVKFAESYDGGKIEKIVIRLFAHLSQTEIYGPVNTTPDYFGVYLYNLNDDGTPINGVLGTGGWKIPVNVKQEQWVDVEITGEDIALFLDDTTGNFEGFQFASRHQWGASANGAYNTNNYFAVSSVTVYSEDEYDYKTAVRAADYVTLDGEGNEQVDASWQTENKLTKIGGWAKNKDGPVQLVTENGEKAFKFTFHRGDQWAGTSGVKFAESYDGGKIEKIVIRLFAHLSQTEIYGPVNTTPDYFGVYLYNLNDDGTPINGVLGTGGWKIPVNVKQEQWVDVEITGEDIALFLDDATGNFEGFQFAARHQWETGTEAYATYNYIAVSSVRVVYGNFRTVTFDYNDDGVTSPVGKEVLFGKPATEPTAPERNGYEFSGWYYNGEQYDFSTPVTSNITLVAEWNATDKLRVSFNTDGGSEISSVWVEPGSLLNAPAAPEKTDNIFECWLLDGAEYDFTAPVNDNLTLVAKWRNMNPVVTQLNGDFSLAESVLQGVYGTAYDGLTAQYGKGKPAWEKVTGQGTSDDSAYKVYFHSYGMTIAASGIIFDTPVNPDEAAFLKIRVYAHLSSGATYSISKGGVRLYPTDATGLDAESGFMIPAGIKQDAWTEITVSGNDMKKLADADGLIRGFQLGAFFHTSSDSELYTGSFSERKAYIAIDGITAGRKAYVTYVTDGSVEDTAVSYTGLTFDYVLPDVAGKVFLGWFKEDGTEVTPDYVLDWDLKVTASFVDADVIVDGTYFDESAQGKLGEGGYITVKDGVADVGDVFEGAVAYSGFYDGKLVVYAKDGTRTVFMLGEGGFVGTETVKISFVTGFGEDFSYDVVAGKKINPVYVERLGYILYGWKAEETEEYFDFDNPIVQAVTLTAQYGYDEISEQSWYVAYAGTFYGAASGTTLTLGTDKTFSLSGNGTELSGNYLILSSGTLVILGGDGKEEYALTAQAVEYVDGEILVKLKEVTVSFETDGGSKIASQTVGAEQNYKATKPQNPVKDGYVFDGWKLADGSDFDFDAVLTEGVQLFAAWKAEEPENVGGETEEKSGCGAYVSISSVAFALVAAGAAALTIRKRKEN